MSSETRTIRPYRGVDHFQGVLDRAQLYVGDRPIDGGSRVSLTADEYLNYPITLRLAADEHDRHENEGRIADGLGDLALATSDVELVVLTSAPRLKMVDVVFANRLDELQEVPAVVDFPRERPRALRGPLGGCDIRVYFCLARQFPPRALAPVAQGHVARQAGVPAAHRPRRSRFHAGPSHRRAPRRTRSRPTGHEVRAGRPGSVGVRRRGTGRRRVGVHRRRSARPIGGGRPLPDREAAPAPVVPRCRLGDRDEGDRRDQRRGRARPCRRRRVRRQPRPRRGRDGRRTDQGLRWGTFAATTGTASWWRTRQGSCPTWSRDSPAAAT